MGGLRRFSLQASFSILSTPEMLTGGPRVAAGGGTLLPWCGALFLLPRNPSSSAASVAARWFLALPRPRRLACSWCGERAWPGRAWWEGLAAVPSGLLLTRVCVGYDRRHWSPWKFQHARV